MSALNRTVVAPLSSAIITVMVAGLVVAAVDKVDRTTVKEGTARLEATGLVEVSVGGAPFVRASHGRTLGARDQVRVVDGSAVLELPHNSKVELRSGSAVTVNGAVSPELGLDDGDLLVDTGRGDTIGVDGGTSVIAVAGSAKLRRGVSLAAGVYEGTARFQRNDQGLTVPQYRQAAVVGTGIMPQAPEPLSLSASDEWDRRELGPVMALDEQLTLYAHSFEADAPASPGPDFYKGISATISDLPLTPELLGGRAPGENLIGFTLVGMTQGDFLTRFQQVFGFRSQGASWGLVAADRNVNATPVLNDLEAALGKLHPGGLPSDLAAGPGGRGRNVSIGGSLLGGLLGGGSGSGGAGASGSGGSGAGGTGPGGPGGTGGSGGTGGGSGGTGGSGGGSGGSGGGGGGKQKLIDVPPTGTFLDPVLDPIVNPVEDLLSGLLGGVLGQGTSSTGTGSTSSTPTTQPSGVLPATQPTTPTSGSTGSGTTTATGSSGTTATTAPPSGSSPTTTTTVSSGLLGGVVGGLTKTVGGLL